MLVGRRLHGKRASGVNRVDLLLLGEKLYREERLRQGN